jgi:hypothetical protein
LILRISSDEKEHTGFSKNIRSVPASPRAERHGAQAGTDVEAVREYRAVERRYRFFP